MKRKRKRKILSSIIIFFSLVIIGCILYIIWYQEPKNFFDKYLNQTKEIIEKYDIKSKIKEKPYSKTLEEMLLSEKYQSNFIDEYMMIDYHDQNNFLDDVNKLLELGYKNEEINNIYTKYNNETINYIVSLNNKFDFNYLSIPNFIFDNHSRYENYREQNNLELSKIVTYTNIGLDREFYSQYDNIINPETINVIVNKYHKLSENYVPSDLVKLYNGKLIKSEAKEPLMDLINDAKKVGIDLTPRSVYRSYSYQTDTYNNYVLRDGKTKADTFSARPGFSEHQTGLAIDLANSSGVFITDNSKEYNWLKDNVYNYGFIIRYQLGSELITGYKFEPWHIRYVGIEHSIKISELNITYDEYYDLYIKEKK